MRSLVAIVLAGLVTPTLAGPRSEADDKAFAAALEKGRALEANGKHADAALAFQAAVKIDATDPTALAELGWVQYELKDLPTAEATMRQAVAHARDATFAGDPAANVRSAALYNLGKIQLDRGDRTGAIASYREAAHVRATRAVRTELAKLDRDAAAATDPFEPVKLEGPFDSVAAYCAIRAVRDGFSQDPTSLTECETPTTYRFEGRGKPPTPAPIRDVTLFQTIDRTELDIAIKLDAGWYIDAITTTRERGTPHCGGTEFHWKGITNASTAGRVRLRVEYTSAGGCSHSGNGHDRDWGWNERGVAAIGIGASGVLSAAPPVTLHTTEWSQNDEQPKIACTDIALAPTWGTDEGAIDTLQIAGKVHDCATPALDAEVVLGAHVLEYP